MIEDVRNEQAAPDDEADEGYGIDADDTAQAGFPELADIRDQADREEAEDKEDGPQEVSLSGAGFRSVDDARLQPASCKNDDQGQDKPMMNFGKRSQISRLETLPAPDATAARRSLRW